MPALVRFSIFATVLTLGSPTPTCTSVVWPNCELTFTVYLLFLASQPCDRIAGWLEVREGGLDFNRLSLLTMDISKL